MARLLLSVAPEVNMISLLSAYSKLPIFSLAFSTPYSDSQPNIWDHEWGLPNLYTIKGNIFSNTLGSIGVVAALSRYIDLPVN